METQLLLKKIKYNENGLVPVITQDTNTKEVLMMAWMNEVSLLQTLKTKKVCYWSRSRQSLWVKGETSGNHQKLISCQLDCDYDTLLIIVDQTGVACHTGEKTCFFQELSIS